MRRSVHLHRKPMEQFILNTAKTAWSVISSAASIALGISSFFLIIRGAFSLSAYIARVGIGGVREMRLSEFYDSLLDITLGAGMISASRMLTE